MQATIDVKAPGTGARIASIVLLAKPSGYQKVFRCEDKPALPSAVEPVSRFGDFTSRDPETRRMLDDLQRIAAVDVNLLIIGETGTGKELLARHVHACSARRNEPYLAVNCGAISEHLMESTFFGYVKGAFSGADPRGRAGYFESAQGGTLFLDEVGELPPAMQAALLRVLEDGSFQRVGPARRGAAAVSDCFARPGKPSSRTFPPRHLPPVAAPSLPRPRPAATLPRPGPEVRLAAPGDPGRRRTVTATATPPRPSSRQRAFAFAGASALLLAVLFGLFPGVVLRGEVPCERDLTTLHWPLRAVYERLVETGGWPPAWNPLEDNGQPFAANPQHAALHPLTWLFHLLPFATAFSLQLLLPLVGGAAAMLLLLRTLGLGRPASLYGALTWGFGGWALSLSNLPPLLLTAAPLPAVLAFAVRIRRGGRAPEIVGLAACLALACAGGEPLSLAAGTIALGVVAFAHSALVGGGDAAPPARRRSTPALAAAVALGLLIAAASETSGSLSHAKGFAYQIAFIGYQPGTPPNGCPLFFLYTIAQKICFGFISG